MSSNVVVAVAVGLIVLLVLVYVGLGLRKEKRRVASLTDEERRREAATKRWGNQYRENGERRW